MSSMASRAGSMALALVLAAATMAAAQAPRGDAEVSLTYGVLAYLDEEYGEAVAQLEDAVRLAPDDATARHWLGLAYRAASRDADAQRELDAAAALDASLTVAPGQPGPSLFTPEGPLPGPAPRVSGWASYSFGADSNPTLLSEDLVAFPPGYDPVAGETRDTMGRLDLQGHVRLAGGPQTVSPEIVVRLSQVRYQELDFADGGSLEGRFQVAGGRTPDGLVRGPLGTGRLPVGNAGVAWLAQAALSRERIGGEPWSDAFTAAGVVSVRTGRVGRFEADALLRNVELEDDPGEPFTIAGRLTTIGVRQQFSLGRADRWVRVGFTTGQRDAGDAYDARIRYLSADVVLPLVTDRGFVGLSVAAGQETFDTEASNPLATGVREDDLRSVSVVLSVRVAGRIYVSGRLARIMRETNLDGGVPASPDLGYERVLTTAGVTWAF
jgi:hypothetical protein